MADDTTKATPTKPTASKDFAPGEAPVSAPSGALDESPVKDAEVKVESNNAKAQVKAEGPKPVQHVTVHETHVKVDEVVTDPSSPLAVQVPPAGRGNALTPIGRTYGVDKPETVEDVFARES